MKKIKMRLKSVFCYMLFGMILFQGCQKENGIIDPPEDTQESITINDGMIMLGKKLENPYTVENMQIAYRNLQNSNQLKSAMTIETTHYYVRFLPKSEEELEVLKSDSLELFDFPLDYEMEEGGTYYHDPTISEDQVTWQYTRVPVDYIFPNVKYEILADLYLQEEDDEDETGLKNSSIEYFNWITLENEALQITNNLEDEESYSSQLKGSKWKPSGKIQVVDDRLDTIPLEGVRVVVKRWFKWKHDITDVNGYFQTGSFRSKVKYAIKWERDDFDIRSGSYGQAWYNFGDATKSSWNLTINKKDTPKSWLYAHIHRAAITYYYYNDRWGINTPPERGNFLSQRLHIAGKDKAGRSHYYTFNKFAQSATVVVYSKASTGKVYDSRSVFGTTIHELAHASHWEIGYSTGQYVVDAIFDSPFLPESWAVGVETKITHDVYGSYNTRQSETIEDMSDGYTCIVWDLMDNVNQYGTNSNYPNDKVTGYTLSQLEDALPGSLGSWWRWRDRIKEKYDNSTEDHLDELFQSFKK